ncbi:MAG: hypothetical protein CR968_06255 [Flavobacteriia bacterium]|nr:MAG: hypothetical protein CR968_06255 [Flavobacteriia bacterium]
MKKILLIAVLMTLVSCNDFFEFSVPIEVEPHESKIAPGALLGNMVNNENQNNIYVSRSKGALDNTNTPLYLSDATVTLTSGNDVFIYTESQDHPGLYTPEDEIVFTAGQQYELTVEKSGFQTVFASQTFPAQVPIISATYDNEFLKVKFKDTAQQQDYYAVEMFRITPSGTAPCDLKPFGSNTINSSTNYARLLFSDETFDGNNYEFKARFETQGNNDGTQYIVYLHHITADYYKYDKALGMNNDVGNNPFAEPVIMYTNIEQGYGIFGMSNTSEFMIE